MLLGTETGSRPTLRAVPPLREPVAALQLVTTVAADAPACVCGHPQDAHEHYRAGSDCALCDCPRFRRRR